MPTCEKPVAVITGAGSGIGRAVALAMAHAGYHCVLAARTRQALEQTDALIRDVQPDTNTLIVPTDVADPNAVQHLIDTTLEHFERIDVLANVAGYAPLVPLDQIDNPMLERVTAVNYYAIVYTTRACWPIFKKHGQGVICNISSMASIDPFTGFNIYGAAKAAVNIFTKAAADEGAVHNIKAYAIAPGAVETPMLRASFDEDTLPRDKTLSPDEVTKVVMECLTGLTDMQSGETQVLPSP